MPTVSLYKSKFHGFSARTLESEQVRLVVVPEAGAKIVSLFDKVAGYEWLVTPAQSHPFRLFDYGTEYNSNQPGGWDEMFPTILACPYPAPGPWHGIELPDHGELWTLPWQEAGANDGAIRLSVAGRALPYRLTRTLSLVANEVLFEYELENLGDQPLAYLWAAHPQFAAEPDARILLPGEVSEVINVLPLEWGPEWGPAGTRNPWPAKEALRQDVVAAPTRGGGRKFYVPPEEPIAWAGLALPDGRSRLIMEWDAAALPYCGVWIDEGYLNKVSAVAIEPTTAYYDNLAPAWANGQVAVVAAGGRASWRLRVRIEAHPRGGD